VLGLDGFFTHFRFKGFLFDNPALEQFQAHAFTNAWRKDGILAEFKNQRQDLGKLSRLQWHGFASPRDAVAAQRYFVPF
jgi:hypothetical protein